MKVPYRDNISGMAYTFTKRNELFFSGEKWGKLKTEERTVVMLIGNNYLAFFIDGMYIIVVIIYNAMHVFPRHNARKEYDEHKPAQ